MATARARAQHQVADEPRVFTDPFAERIVGETAMRANEFDRGLDPEMVRLRRFIIAGRSRFADDAVADAVAGGIRQVVVLGAGLDTTAYRHTDPDVRFFEVDHPDTQEWKRHRLAEAGIAIPDSLTFAPVDFEQSTLAAGLAEAGLDRTRGAVFLWLGVIMYLTEASGDDTLRYIAGQGGPVELVFDYVYPIASSGRDATARQARADRVAAAGEPWISFFTADEIRSKLQSLGFQRIEDRSVPELLAGYGVRATHPIDVGGHMVRASRSE